MANGLAVNAAFCPVLRMYLQPVDRTDLARRIYDAAHLTGTFTLRSGVVSNEYFDKYRFESDPQLLGSIAAACAQLVPAGIDALAGLELGGVPLATMISQATGLPAVFVRKEAKTYGTCRLAEGADIDGRRLCIIEDVVTSGGAILDAASELHGARGPPRTGDLCHRSRVGRPGEAGGRRPRTLCPLHDERAQRGCSGRLTSHRSRIVRVKYIPSWVGLL